MAGPFGMKIAYFTSRYPAVSHTFIRREIRALETLGASISRFALQPGDGLVDAEDIEELEQTRYILRASAVQVVRCCISTLLLQPRATSRAVLCAIKMGWRSDSGILRHFAYLAEAAVLADWCAGDAVQHLHVHFGTNPAAVAVLTSRLSGIPYSFTAHGSGEFEKAPLMSLGLKLEHAAFAVCVSSFGRSQLMRWSSPDQWHKISVIRCGIDRAYLDMPATPPSTFPRFVCVGRLSEEKGQLVLLAAARRLRQAGIHFEIVLAGDGPMRSILEEAIRRSGLQNHVTITGWITGEQVKAELIAARALILPSFMENLPVVIMEAMALGRPVISSQVAGIPELVEPETTGWLVPAGDDVALSEALRKALEASLEQLSSMGRIGRCRVAENHDALKEATKLRDLFDASFGLARSPPQNPVDMPGAQRATTNV
jgi:colanic acid/amylovoran biosynthesis glycosyltransferase